MEAGAGMLLSIILSIIEVLSADLSHIIAYTGAMSPVYQNINNVPYTGYYQMGVSLCTVVPCN